MRGNDREQNGMFSCVSMGHANVANHASHGMVSSKEDAANFCFLGSGEPIRLLRAWFPRATPCGALSRIMLGTARARLAVFPGDL